MKIVFTAKGAGWESEIDPRFGRTDFLFFFDEESNESSTVDNTDVQNSAHGAGPQTSKKLIELNPDILITGNGPGGNASTVLEKTGIKIFVGAQNMTVKEAYDAWKSGSLAAF